MPINLVNQVYMILKDTEGRIFIADCINPVISQSLGEYGTLYSDRPVRTRLESELIDIRCLPERLPFDMTEDEIIDIVNER